jgi:hypothetical protein
MVLPIEGGRAFDDVCVLQDWGIPVGRKIRPRFKQQDAALRIGAQSRRKNRTGRATAYNDDVEDLHDDLLGHRLRKNVPPAFLGLCPAPKTELINGKPAEARLENATVSDPTAA